MVASSSTGTTKENWWNKFWLDAELLRSVKWDEICLCCRKCLQLLSHHQLSESKAKLENAGQPKSNVVTSVISSEFCVLWRDPRKSIPQLLNYSTRHRPVPSLSYRGCTVTYLVQTTGLNEHACAHTHTSMPACKRGQKKRWSPSGCPQPTAFQLSSSSWHRHQPQTGAHRRNCRELHGQKSLQGNLLPFLFS